jgi:hypothetical protein
LEDAETMLTTPAATADLVRQALQEQTTELTAVLSAAAAQRPRMLVVVPPEDVRDGILEADGLQRALAPVTAAARASNNANTAAAAVSAATVAAPPAVLDAAVAMRRGLRPARRTVQWSLSTRASPPWRRSCGSGSRGWEGLRRCGSWRSGSGPAGGTLPPSASGSTSGGS